MTDIAQWLESLGMAEYSQRFADEAIDIASLPQLTDGNLTRLGVVKIGHRARLRRADRRTASGASGTTCSPARRRAASKQANSGK